MPHPATPQRFFLAPNLSLAEAAADWVVTSVGAEFARAQIIVPTARAGDYLRASLEKRGVANAQILTGGEWVGQFLADRVASPLVARRLMASAVRTLREAGQCTSLFPNNDPDAVSEVGILRTADLLLDLRHTLVEEGHSLQSALKGLETLDGFTEKDRWQDILDIENLYINLIREAGLNDGDSVLLSLLSADAPPSAHSAVVLAFNPDPPPYLIKLLEKWPLPCAALVAASESMAGCFDKWGRPLTSFWANPREATIEMEPFEKQVVVTATAAELARHLSETVLDDTAVGILHDDLAVEFESLCAVDGIATYNPDGTPANQTGVGALLEVLPHFIKTGSFSDVQTLVRHRDIGQWLRAQWGAGHPDESFPLRKALCELDDFSNERLPGTLDTALTLIEDDEENRVLRFVLRKLQDLRVRFSASKLSDLPKIFEELFEASVITQDTDPDHIERSAREQLFKLLDSLKGQWGVFLSVDDLIQSLATQLRITRIYYPRPDGAREYQGWLELSYDASPNLMLYGLVEGVVPTALRSSVFLPESARRALGLRSNEQRYARDAFLLWHMIESRKEQGTVTIGYAQRSSDGDPQKPSRFFYHCDDKALPRRVAHLFSRKAEASQRPAWELTWKLSPPNPNEGAKVKKLRVTAFREYLECPYRFYLRNVLKMKPYEPNRLDMDERSFGTLMHNTLEAFGKSSTSASKDAKAISAYCEEQMMHQVEKIYGNRARRNLAVELQVESALQRLRAFSEIQAREAEAGWEIVAVEQKFEIPFTIREKEIKITGTIDRIERRVSPDSKATEWRVLDYKTYDKSDNEHSPENDHIAKIGKSEPPAFARLDEESYWKNLQLPLYIHALRSIPADALSAKLAPDDSISTAYIILPKAVTSTELLPWTLDKQTLDSASDCAKAVLTSVTEGVYWPPGEPKYDDFEEILSFPDAVTAVQPPIP